MSGSGGRIERENGDGVMEQGRGRRWTDQVGVAGLRELELERAARQREQWAEWQEQEPEQMHGRPRPGIWQNWRALADVLAVWGMFCWWVTMMVRGREVGPWELAGFATGLVMAAVLVAGKRERQSGRDGRDGNVR